MASSFVLENQTLQSVCATRNFLQTPCPQTTISNNWATPTRCSSTRKSTPHPTPVGSTSNVTVVLIEQGVHFSVNQVIEFIDTLFRFVWRESELTLVTLQEFVIVVLVPQVNSVNDSSFRKNKEIDLFLFLCHFLLEEEFFRKFLLTCISGKLEKQNKQQKVLRQLSKRSFFCV